MTSIENLKMKVDLSFSATDVPSYDLTSPSDPVVIVYQKLIHKQTKAVQFNKIGRTEPLLDQANPKWSTKVRFDYEFENVQHLRIMIYDVDAPKEVDNLSKQELIGYVDITLGQLMSAPNSSLRLEVFKENSTTEKHKKMRLTISGSEVVDSRMWAIGQIRGVGLSKHGIFSQDDTSLEFVKKRADGTVNVFYQSPAVLKNNKDPLYAPFQIGLGSVFQGVDEISTPMTVRVVRVRRDDYKSRVVIGEITLPVSSLLKESSAPDISFDIKNGEKVTGKIQIVTFRVEEQPTFLDYVRNGLTFRLYTHIDFTASNNNGPINLHKIDARTPNEYQTAIRAVGDVLTAYTRSSNIQATGYGALVSVNGGPRENNFCFPLTLSSDRWAVRDVDELLYAYDYALKNLTLSGPTRFAPGIERVHTFTQEPQTSTFQHFNIMLIITDGVITDMAQTVDAIVRASDAPLSIIIVGVGGADFDAMEVLDGDEQRLTSPTFGAAIRDIVQFVPMRDLAGDMGAISEAVLREVPDHVISWARMKNIKPLQLPDMRRQSTTGGYAQPTNGGYTQPASNTGYPANGGYVAPQ